MRLLSSVSGWLALVVLGSQYSTFAYAQTSCKTSQISPAPSALSCGAGGTLSTPDPLGGPIQIPQSSTSAFVICRNLCLANSNSCISFAFTPSTRACQLYGKSLNKQGFKSKKAETSISYYAAGCFTSSCKTVVPPSTTTTSTTTTSSTTTTTPPPTTTPPSTTITGGTGGPPPTSIPPATCTDIFVANVGCFLDYYSGSGDLLNPANPGNTDGMPQTATVGNFGTGKCAAAQACGNLNNSTAPYYSFALYFDGTNWTCVRYLGINDDGMGPPARWFNVSDSDVQLGYGYNLYTSCLG